MPRRFFLGSLVFVAIYWSLMFSAEYVWAQWLPPQPQRPQYPPPPPVPPGHPPGFFPQQPGHLPQQPVSPPRDPGFLPIQPPQVPGQIFSDAFGRFRVNLPQGTVPLGATYNFGIPSAMCQVSIIVVGQDQMFQMQMQNFPSILRQMGANVDSESQIDVGGRPARVISAVMRDPMSGMSIRSINVFIQGANLWVQVMGSDQNPQQVQQLLQAILGGLQF